MLAGATLEQCAVAFAAHGSRGSPKFKAETGAHLRLGLEEMGTASLKPVDLKQARVMALARHHAERPSTARHRVGSINRLFLWLIAHEAVASNPASCGEGAGSPGAPRSRVYSAGEVRSLWASADMLPPARRDYLRLAITAAASATGTCRRTRRRDCCISQGDRSELVISASPLEERPRASPAPCGRSARHC